MEETLEKRVRVLQKRNSEYQKFIKMLRHNMGRMDFDFCQCGGFHYVGKDNYNAYKCSYCKNLFCNGMTRENLDRNESYIMELSEELEYKCGYILCNGCLKDVRRRVLCNVQGCCYKCFSEGSSKLSHCTECREYWCCPEHKGCECSTLR